jgi:hypothetical protein
MKKWMVFFLILLSFSLFSGLSPSLAFVSPDHYEKMKQEKEAKKKTTLAPKLKKQTQLVQSNQKNNSLPEGENTNK